MPRGREPPLPWSCRRRPCPPRRRRVAAVNELQRDPRSPEAPLRRLAIGLAGHTGRHRHDRLSRVRAGTRRSPTTGTDRTPAHADRRRGPRRRPAGQRAVRPDRRRRDRDRHRRTPPTSGSQALILQVNSSGAVVSDDEMEQLLEAIADAPVPIGIWVGPTGARLYGTAGAAARRRRRHRHGARRRIGYIGVAAQPVRTSRSTSVSPRNGCATGRSACPTPATLGVLQAAHRRRGDPDRHEHGAGARRLQRERWSNSTPPIVEVLDDGTARYDTIADGPLLEAVAGRPAVPHRRQPAGRLPAAAHRAGAARVRVLHRRRRHRRGRRRRVHWCSACYGHGRAAARGRGRSP